MEDGSSGKAVRNSGAGKDGIQTNRSYRNIVENAVIGIYQTTVAGRYLRVNRALAELYGYDSAEALVTGLTDIAGQLYVNPRRREDFAAAMVRDDVVENFEAEVRRRDGSTIWIQEYARCVRRRDGSIDHYEGMVMDITRRKQAEDKIRLLAAVFENISEGIALLNGAMQVHAVNGPYEIITGRTQEELVGRLPPFMGDLRRDSELVRSMAQEAVEGGRWQGEVACVRRDQSPFEAWVTLTPVRDLPPGEEYFVLVCSDISSRKRQEARIRFQAQYDVLTGLPNRRHLQEQLERAIVEAERTETQLVVAFLDIDRFKRINDSLGHAAGDDLLRKVARRLRNCTRGTDTVGRYGGDEFVVVFPVAHARKTTPALVEKMLYSFSDPFILQGREMFSLPSVGIAVYPEDGSDPETLISAADLAMYHAKRSGPRQWRYYSPVMRCAQGDRLTLENDLRRAHLDDELLLEYQPRLDVLSGRITGAEALVRWQHPSLGRIPPGNFIPLAEETGFISAIGEWTLRRACRQLRQWRREGVPLPSVAVNLSPSQFNDSRLVQMVARIVQEEELAPGELELELTESAMSVDMERAIDTLSRLRLLGVGLAVDDFGTGYSSLAYLTRLPMDTVKIDRSFVRDLGATASAGAVAETIIALARTLRFTVVAEGVETEMQKRVLGEMRCHQLQGYLISPPLPPERLVSFLMNHTPGIRQDIPACA